MPCICGPAREAESQDGMSHLTLWCGTCSAEDHRDTRFYEPPHQVSYSGPVSGWMTRPDVLARRTRRPGRRPRPRADLRPGLLTMLTIWLAVCALTMLAVLADAACSAATANSAGFGKMTTIPVPVHGDGDAVTARWFSHVWHCRSGI
jgi:hypothetical protein